MADDQRPKLFGLLAETTAIQVVGAMAVLAVPAMSPSSATKNFNTLG